MTGPTVTPSLDGHAGEARRHRERRRGELLELLTRRGLELPRSQRLTWISDMQQGDGGKGAMTDRLAPSHQIVVRVQGGDNAGHTTVFRDAEGSDVVLKGHLLPSGLRHDRTVGVIANGVLLNPGTLAAEITDLARRGVDCSGRLLLSDRAHLVLPLHLLADARQEDGLRKDGRAIGTTQRGIGPANVCRTNRSGVRVRDLDDMAVVEGRIRQSAALLGLPDEHVPESLAWLEEHRHFLQRHSVDSVRLLNAAADAGYSILFEGAQGPLIDLDHGIYPYVTTSATAIHSVASGTGLDLTRIHHRVGVLKCYQTMVGNGAFVTEDTGELGARLRERGQETGTTTGRPRRCGWLDLPHARWAAELNGNTSVALTKLDVLDGFDLIGVCVGYERDGRRYLPFEPDHAYLAGCAPMYAYLPGWRTSTRAVRRYADLPAEARALADFVSRYLDLPVSGIGTGPRDTDLLTVPLGELDHLMRPAPPRVPAPRAGHRKPPRVTVFCGAAPGVRPNHRALAADLGRACAERGVGIVYGAGGVGMMGALSDAALGHGGEVIGVIPEPLKRREFCRPDLADLRVVPTMHQRKMLMHELGDAFIALPGGYGTLEELLEMITWAQLGLHEKPVILLDDTGHFQPLIDLFDHAHAEGFVADQDRSLVVRARTAEEALHLAHPSQARR
ncbi:adenylosuccinate synthetase [Actinomadura harenae]|uniref:Adenylosuccinate synthetase n=1 Tax=Actinomadura harenae TaxID=2483351 RepID=A0A3M2LWM5_9ACTN|nr:TIGR00730 family Rossman fold protein [Actinomadura harenae]RMI41612.1 TIGR00730 family Rossman fold protein [Actinomadura harenae]